MDLTRWTRWSAGSRRAPCRARRRCGQWRSSRNWSRTRRNIYAGCIGYFAANGTMDTCIGLRTALVKDGVMYVQAGAGIVADSVAEAEDAGVPAKGARIGSGGGGGGSVRGGQRRRE